MNPRKISAQALDKKIEEISHIENLKKPIQGWIRTIRNALGMTSAQLSHRMNISQPRIIDMEKNENNLKISTLEKVAAALNCRLVYAFIPNGKIEDMVERMAQIKAEKMFRTMNHNMALEDQQIQNEQVITELKNDLLEKHIKNIWE